MEIRSDIIEVFITSVANLPRNLESTNTVNIYLHDVIQEVIEGVREPVTHLGLSHIRLKPRGGVSSPHLSEFLRYRLVPQSGYIGQRIAHGINQRLANDNSLREPVFVTVDVIFLDERRLFLSPPTTPSRGASQEVLQRLVEEQRVESKDLEGKSETHQCSICIVDFRKSRECIIELPECKHMFHENCLFEWLSRHNSCPLCRSIPYEEDSKQTGIKVRLY